MWSVPVVCPLEGQGLGEPGSGPDWLPQGQAQECLLEKSMLDNRKSFLVARISAQVGMGSCAQGRPLVLCRRPLTPPRPPGGGLLQGGLPGLGEPRHGLAAGPDPEGLEEAGADEELLLCGCGSCEGTAPLALGWAEGGPSLGTK